LEHAQVAPGHRGVVTLSHADGSLTVCIDGNNVDIDAFSSARILVTQSLPAVVDGDAPPSNVASRV
jgi:hypothetical protein